MRRSALTIAVLLAAAPLAAQSETRQPQPTGYARAVLSLGVPGSVEPDKSVPVDVTAADDRGIQEVIVRLGDDVVRIPGERRQRVSRSLLLPGRGDVRDAQLEVVVVDVTGARGEPVTRQLAVRRDQELASDPEWIRGMLPHLLDDGYAERVSPFSKEDDSVIRLPEDDRPWWVRWTEKGGPAPFDYQKECGPGAQTITPFGGVLECWLAKYPNVAQVLIWQELDANAGPVDQNGVHKGVVTPLEYKDWPFARKADLYGAFYWHWKWLHDGLGPFFGTQVPAVPPNQLALEDHDGLLTILSYDDAWWRFANQVGLSLAVEIGGFVPWSITSYKTVDLKELLYSGSFYQPGYYHWNGADTGTFHSVTGYAINGYSLPAPPVTAFKFLVDNDVLRSSAFYTVGKMLDWGRSRFYHTYAFLDINDGTDALSAQAFWSYRGVTPATRVVLKTLWKNPQTGDTFGDFEHHVIGCFGISYFLRSMLRAANIPVQTSVGNIGQTGHTAPIFLTIGHAMSHGDDAHSSYNYVKTTPMYPAHELLVPMAQYYQWFYGPDMPFGTGKPNVGRQVQEIALDRLSDNLLTRYCSDKQMALDPVNGTVGEFFVSDDYPLYTVPQLEAMHLWTKLKVKAAAKGFCVP